MTITVNSFDIKGSVDTHDGQVFKVIGMGEFDTSIYITESEGHIFFIKPIDLKFGKALRIRKKWSEEYAKSYNFTIDQNYDG